MAAAKRTRSIEERREQAVAAAEQNRSYRFHDILVIVSLFATYAMFFYRRRSPGDEGDT